jgi:hypothetical protein
VSDPIVLYGTRSDGSTAPVQIDSAGRVRINGLGERGEAATVVVGNVRTGAAGSAASVSNSGTSGDAVLNFEIPRGDKGDKGEPGDNYRAILTQTLTYASTIDLDLAALTGTHQLLALTGAVEFITSNRASGRWVTIFIDPGASDKTLTFPAGWTFYSAKPSTQTANKRAVLTLKANGTELSDVHAVWKEAP